MNNIPPAASLFFACTKPAADARHAPTPGRRPPRPLRQPAIRRAYRIGETRRLASVLLPAPTSPVKSHRRPTAVPVLPTIAYSFPSRSLTHTPARQFGLPSLDAKYRRRSLASNGLPRRRSPPTLVALPDVFIQNGITLGAVGIRACTVASKLLRTSSHLTT